MGTAKQTTVLLEIPRSTACISRQSQKVFQVFVSAGDEGALAELQRQSASSHKRDPPSAGMRPVSPYAVAVGGTDFEDSYLKENPHLLEHVEFFDLRRSARELAFPRYPGTTRYAPVNSSHRTESGSAVASRKQGFLATLSGRGGYDDRRERLWRSERVCLQGTSPRHARYVVSVFMRKRMGETQVAIACLACLPTVCGSAHSRCVSLSSPQTGCWGHY